jgi:hypothetical protein
MGRSLFGAAAPALEPEKRSMKQVLYFSMVVAVGMTTGCIKSSAESSVNADGTATVRLWVAYQTSTFESMKKAPLDCTCWRIYQIHKDSIAAARRALDSFEASFEAKKVSERWTSLGLTVTKAAVSEANGWRILEMEASAADIAAASSRLAKEMAAGGDEFLTALPWYLHTRKLLPKLPRFYKTAEPDVVKVTIPVADVGPELADLSELNEEKSKKLRTQLGYMRTMKSFDDGEIKVRMKLPGTILSVENGKQEGSDVVLLDVKGSDVEPQSISAQARTRGLVTAKLRVDPKTFKIALESE